MEFEEFNADLLIKDKLIKLNKSVEKIDSICDTLFNANIKDKLSKKDKVNYDLFMAYSLNTLFWLYLRSRGVDPNGSDVKKELDRVRDYMLKAKSAEERHTIRPTLNQPVAKRFIKRGINLSNSETERQNKKRKF